MWWCNLSSDILTNTTLSANICGAGAAGKCVAICPNADLSGVGVRSAFYIQSFLNTLLVVFSRRDSVPSTWAATLFTGSLVIAAMVQKQAQTITLHHAILTMNFATLSCIGSLAVAPTLPIWRLSPQEYYARQVARDLLNDEEGHQDRMVGQAVEAMTKGHKRGIVRAQSRARLFLAIALLTQVVLQWAWGIVLFVSPVYSQKECSGDTHLIFFLAQFTARDINDKYMVVWVLWLLFSLGVTLFMTIILALTSPVRARSWTQRSTPVSTVGTSRLSSTPGSASSRPVIEQMLVSARSAISWWRVKAGQLIFWYNVLCILLWFVYIIASEIQIQANCIFDGENSIMSFGQITALLLSLAPVWSLTVALYKWPELQRKLERRKRQEQLRLQRTLSLNSPVEAAANSGLGWVPADMHGTVLDTIVPVVAATPGTTIAPPAPTVTGDASTPARTHRRVPRGPRTPSGVSPLSEWHFSRTSSSEWHELAAFNPHSPG